MIATRLNLLPPEKQKYLRRMIIAQFAKNTLESVLALLAIGGIALLLGLFLSEKYFVGHTQNIVHASSETARTRERARDINRAIARTKRIQDEYILWSPILESIAGNIPEGVLLSGMSLDMNAKIFTFAGLARTRDDLLRFEQHLESLAFVSSVNLPLSDLTQQTKISFELTAALR